MKSFLFTFPTGREYVVKASKRSKAKGRLSRVLRPSLLPYGQFAKPRPDNKSLTDPTQPHQKLHCREIA